MLIRLEDGRKIELVSTFEDKLFIAVNEGDAGKTVMLELPAIREIQEYLNFYFGETDASN